MMCEGEEGRLRTGCVWCCDTPDYDNNNPQRFFIFVIKLCVACVFVVA